MSPHENKTTAPAESRKARPVLLYDGGCGLCDGWAGFLRARDNKGRLSLAPLQSETGKRILIDSRLPKDYLDSVVLWENGRSYFKSTAILRALRTLGGLESLLYAFIAIPAPLRDRIYDWVAARRHRKVRKTA